MIYYNIDNCACNHTQSDFSISGRSWKYFIKWCALENSHCKVMNFDHPNSLLIKNILFAVLKKNAQNVLL